MNQATRKTAKRPAPHRASHHGSHRGSTLLGLFVGLALGLLIALGVAWYLRQAPLPFENKYQPPPAKPAAPVAGSEPKALPLPGKPTDAEAKPRFDFYGILEGKQPGTAAPEGKPVAAVPLPGVAKIPVPATESPVSEAPAVESVLYLQVGAFQKSADADNTRAKLSLMGFEAEIQEAEIPDKGKMYRVRTGPYASAAEMNKARTALAQNGIQASLVKVK